MGQSVQHVGDIERIADFVRPTAAGNFRVLSYSLGGGQTAFALIHGDVPAENLLVRIQSPCLFGESFGVNSCDCAAQLHQSVERGVKEDAFMLVYQTDQEGRGHGMVRKIEAVAIEANDGVDMPEAFRRLNWPLDLREYSTAATIIRDLNGDAPIRLMTNNPKKMDGLSKLGIEVSERVAVLVEPPNEPCRRYLASKKREMGHILPNIEI